MKFFIPFLFLFAWSTATVVPMGFDRTNDMMPITMDREFFFNMFKNFEFFEGYSGCDMVEIDFFKDFVKTDTFFNFYKFMFTFPTRFQVFSSGNRLHMKMIDSMVDMFMDMNGKWDVMRKFICWGRMHINPHMFFHAFTKFFFTPNMMEFRHKFMFPRPSMAFPEMFFHKRVFDIGRRIATMSNFTDVEKYTNNFFCRESNKFFINAEIIPTIDEDRLAYFTRDFEMNEMMFFFFNTLQICDKPGEFFFFFMQQLMARFYMERVVNHMGAVQEINFDFMPIGFKSDIRVNGRDFSSRPFNFWSSTHKFNDIRMRALVDMERTMLNFMDKKFNFMDGENMDNSMTVNDVMGKVFMSMDQMVKTRFFRRFWSIAGGFMGDTKDTNDFFADLSVLEFAETAMRDPMFFKFTKRFMNTFFFRFRNFMNNKMTTFDSMTTCTMDKFEISEMRTFFELFDFDVTDTIRQDRTSAKFFARMHRINHKDFKVTYHTTCPKGTSRMEIRLFMAPVFDEFGKKIDFTTNTFNFFMIDRFVQNFNSESDFTFMRSSNDFTMFGDFMHFMDFKDTPMILNSNMNFEMIKSMKDFMIRFPRRFMLPRGSVGGTPFYFFAMITPVEESRFVTPFGKFFSTFNDFTRKNVYMKAFPIFHTMSKQMFFDTGKFRDTGMNMMGRTKFDFFRMFKNDICFFNMNTVDMHA